MEIPLVSLFDSVKANYIFGCLLEEENPTLAI